MEAGRYFIQTFGCRVNQADSVELAAHLTAENWVRTQHELDADVIVLNTCTVTHRSDSDVRKAVHRIQREHPSARVVVTGCMAQRVPDKLVQLGGVHGVLGNSDKARIGEMARAIRTGSSSTPAQVFRAPFDPTALPPVDPIADVLDRSRPFIKIQDGCDAHCTYCIIPAVRGPARSASAADVVRKTAELIARGHFEIVITGVHLGTYQSGGTNLASLVSDLLDLPGLGRLRLSCIEPIAFPETLIDLAANDPRLAPHFHLPLQSGCRTVLKRMVRPYTPEAYGELIQRIRRRLPNACLGTDVIVGFPGETDAEFEETLAFVESIALDYVHVFSYSGRTGTAATRLGPRVDPGRIKSRSQRLNACSRRLWDAFLERQVGAELDAVALEGDGDDPGRVRAVAANYTPLLVRGRSVAANRPLRCRVERRAGRFMMADDTSDLPSLLDPERQVHLQDNLPASAWAGLKTEFCSAALREAAELASLSADRREDSVRSAAHRLKGLAANFGAARLEALADEIHAAPDRLPSLLHRLRVTVEDTIRALSAS